MKNQFVESSLKNMPTQGLYLLTKDVESRIGSHVAGGGTIIKEYIKSQRSLLTSIQNELESRREK